MLIPASPTGISAPSGIVWTPAAAPIIRRIRSRSGGASVRPSEIKTTPARGRPAVRRRTSSSAGAILVRQPSASPPSMIGPEVPGSGGVDSERGESGSSTSASTSSRSKTPSLKPSQTTSRVSPGFRHAGPASSRIRWRSCSRLRRPEASSRPSRTCMLRLRSTSTATQSGSTSSLGSSIIGPATATRSRAKIPARAVARNPRARRPASSRL